jgi:transcriptional regulator with XRE-family HTH domain
MKNTDFTRAMVLDWRARKGYTQDDVAKRIPLNRTTYSQFENGKRELSATKRVLLAALMNADPADYVPAPEPSEQELMLDELSDKLHALAEFIKSPKEPSVRFWRFKRFISETNGRIDEFRKVFYPIKEETKVHNAGFPLSKTAPVSTKGKH